MSGLRGLRVYAWSMSQLPGMPPIPPPTQGRSTCVSCGGGTYKGSSTCAKCEKSQAALARRFARVPVQPRPRVSCWICGKLIISHGAKRPTCRECHQKHGSGICSGCGAPKRLDTPGLCRNCHDKQRAAIPALPRVCELCECTYVPKYRPRPGTQQRWCSKSCTTAWRNGARPPYERKIVTGMALKVAKARERRLRHAETWDGITDEEILERDGWRCQIPGCKRRPIRRDAKYPHLRSKSIDHIIPLSHGGDDTAVNKRAAHLGCNMSRGNEMREEQVALFGVIREPPLATMTAGERAVMLQPRKRRLCGCGAVPLKGRKFCQDCLDQRAAKAETRRAEKAEQAAPASPVYYFTCRYCGELKAARRAAREVCTADACQLARLAANNLRVRHGMTADEANAQVAAIMAAGAVDGRGKWQEARWRDGAA